VAGRKRAGTGKERTFFFQDCLDFIVFEFLSFLFPTAAHSIALNLILAMNLSPFFIEYLILIVI